ncbi:Tigger transposable element-derived protein 6 [Dictyocoela muelleri]|nr:Tigger transposable element-derived protein 6 [Dictyocoela muelleri]
MKKLSEKEISDFEKDFRINGISERNLAQKYKISKGSVFRLKKHLEGSRSGTLNLQAKTPNFQSLDDQVFEVFVRLRADNVPLNGTTIKMIARKISKKLNLHTFKCSNGWLENFKRRHELTFKNISGESKSADITFVESFKAVLKNKIDEYGEKNIFNCDETALYYKNPPKKSFVTPEDLCKGSKSNKMRITVMLTCSMAGEKFKPLIIGKANNPRPMNGFNPEEVGVEYTSSSKAWMTTKIFKKYINNINEKLRKEGRKILLILDNATPHSLLELSNVELLFLPKNTTSIMQPLDMGIIRAFKCHYFNILIDSCYFHLGDDQFNFIDSTNIKDAIIMISIAWDIVEGETITNCFKKGLIDRPVTQDGVTEINMFETFLDQTIEHVIEETLEVDGVEKFEKNACIEMPVNLIKKAITHFNSFYDLAEQLSSKKLKELLLIKISITKEWKKQYNFGSKITDYLENK